MKQHILIVLLALAGFSALPAGAADPAPAVAATTAPENLAAPGKPCPKPVMDGKPCPSMAHGHPCPPAGAHCDCKHHSDLEARIDQLQKRIDALQMTVEMLVREGAE